MLFKIDENLPSEISALLKANSHDSMTVREQKLSGTNDENLFSVCKKENRILVTLDMDFANILSCPPENCPGIIVLRCSNHSKIKLMGLCAQLAEMLKTKNPAKQLWIVEETQVRIRTGMKKE